MVTENATLQIAGVEPGSRLAKIVDGRADTMALTQATQDAVLSPKVPGGIARSERAALACRMARLSGETQLAAHYETLIPRADAAEAMANPSFDGGGDRRLSALIRHVDLVTQAPKDATRDSITALRDAGIAEADMVRLSELIAFINYQIRVAAGLRLLGEIV